MPDNALYFTMALDEVAIKIGVTADRLAHILRVDERVYQQIRIGKIENTEPMFDALMRFFLILGIREANPKPLLNVTDAEMSGWNTTHNDEVIELVNEIDSRWWTHVKTSYETGKKTLTGALTVFFICVLIAVVTYISTLPLKHVPDLVGIVFVLALLVGFVSGAVTLVTWGERVMYRKRYKKFRS